MNNPWNESPEGKANRTIRETKRMSDAISGIGSSNRGGGGGSASCFPANTAILTPSGLRRIAELRADDFVLAYCKKRRKLAPRRIIKHLTYAPVNIWEIHSCGNGKPIRTTRSHSFLTNSGWKATENLMSSDIIQQVDGIGRVHEFVIRKVSNTNNMEVVFNLIVERENTFVTSTCVVHSFTYARLLRHWWYGSFGKTIAYSTKILASTG